MKYNKELVPDNSLIVAQLTKTFKARDKGQGIVVACDNLNFEVRRGEIFGLLGPNGAGKSTLVHQLIGLMQPTAGQIWLEGIDVIKEPDQVKPLVGFLPQSGHAMRQIEVERALYYTGRLRGQTSLAARQQVAELLSELELGECAQRYVNKLSGGQRRLVYFAMSLMGRPPVLVLDEVTNELDPHNRRVIWDKIARLNRTQGVTCILVTHNVLEAEQVVQRVAVMQQGRFIALGTPGELKARVGGKVRLELKLKEGFELSTLQLSNLAGVSTLEEVRPSHFRLYLPAEQVALVTERVVNQLGLVHLDDFRLAPPSLEDIYLELDPGSSALSKRKTLSA